MDRNIIIRKKMMNLRTKKLKGIIEEEFKKAIIDKYEENVIKLEKDFILLKFGKFGFEIVKSLADNKYWINSIIFIEPFDPKSPKFKQNWIGNSVLSYGFEKVEEVLDKLENLVMFGGPSTPERDYMFNWIEEKHRIILDWEPEKMTYTEYDNFRKWFEKNRIRIMTKQKDVKDSEDYNSAKRTAFTIIMSKIKEKPKRPNSMSVKIFKDPELVDKLDYTKWKYIVGFLFTDD
ncbi:hypothetical protein NPX79_00920 [Spiroplasma endosymbiont of Anurida maritima]|uniref:hypothetical protein n=1 Tax=Spiroplasma endosymbiont of Anurida maritima TaxID=2967972 RepID=UPI0036D323EF